jgi:peptidase S58-like protein
MTEYQSKQPAKPPASCLNQYFSAKPQLPPWNPSGADNGNSTTAGAAPVSAIHRVNAEHVDSLFTATIQATEEAVDNAMIGAEMITGADYLRSYAIPHDQLREVLRNHHRLAQP